MGDMLAPVGTDVRIKGAERETRFLPVRENSQQFFGFTQFKITRNQADLFF